MSTIKKLNKQNRQATQADVKGLIAIVTKLVEKGFLYIDSQKCEAAFKPEHWDGRDGTFKDAWCTNILTYWCIMHAEVDRYKRVLVLYDLGSTTRRKLGTYNLRTGFVPAD